MHRPYVCQVIILLKSYDDINYLRTFYDGILAIHEYGSKLPFFFINYILIILDGVKF